MRAITGAGRIIRVFAVINAALAILGVTFLLQTAESFRGIKADASAPYLGGAFYTFWVINFVCVLVGLGSVFFLWKLKRLGLLICNILFGFEILYWVSTLAAVLSLGSMCEACKPVAMSMAGASGIGNVMIGLQIIVGYPVIAPVALNLAYRKLRAPAQPAPSV